MGPPPRNKYKDNISGHEISVFLTAWHKTMISGVSVYPALIIFVYQAIAYFVRVLLPIRSFYSPRVNLRHVSSIGDDHVVNKVHLVVLSMIAQRFPAAGTLLK